MSLAKALPNGIKDKECKRFALPECPPVTYVPEKDPVQVTVSALTPSGILAPARLFSCM
jgi:hypothetical protein